MRTEASTPPVPLPDGVATTTDLLARRVRTAADHVAFGRRTDAGLVDVTTRAFDAQCRGVAKGLVAHEVSPGDRVLVMAPTRYEWAVADFAAWLAGAVVVPLYETASATQIADIVAQVTPRLAIAGSAEHVATLRKAAPDLPVWTMDAGPVDLAALAASGATVTDEEVERRSRLAGPEDVATIVYTSGTTARQKGVRITHGNLVGIVTAVFEAYPEVIHDRASTVVALPLAHVLARGLQLAAVGAGMRVVHEPDRARVVATFAEVRPTFMVVVPQLLARIRQAARDRATGARLGRVFRLAEATAVEWAEHLEAAQDDPTRRSPLSLRARHALFDRLFYRRLRALLGGRLAWLLSGAAPLDPTLARFFWGLGVPVIEGYGLTETTAPAAGLRPGDLRPGSVGTPIPGTTIRIAPDGEVLVRGVGVFAGYVDAADDAEAFDDGFFRTGDLGTLDADGHLTLRGRAKNILVTASGKNVAPEPWEEAVDRSPLVSQAVLVGDGRSYLAGLLLVDADAVARWARHRKLDDLAALLDTAAPPGGLALDHPELRARLQRSVDRANAAVSRAEQAKRFTALLIDTSAGSTVMTPTLKVRREALLQAAAVHVDALYDRSPS